MGWRLAAFAAAALCMLQAAAQPAARSSDGRWRLEAGEPASLFLFDASGARVRTWPAAALDGSRASAVTGLRDNPARRSFLASFATLPELWEISYDPAAEPIFDGLVHDYRMGEGIARSGYLGVRRTPLEAPLAVLAIAAHGRHVLGTTVHPEGGVTLDLVHLDVRRRIARRMLPLAPSPAAIRLFEQDGREFLSLVEPGGAVLVLDARTLEVSCGPDARCASPATPPPAR